MPSVVTFSGCLIGKYSAEAGSVNCTACEAGEQSGSGRQRDGSAGVGHTEVMAACMRSEAERRRHALTMRTLLAGNYSDVLGAAFCPECPSYSTSAAQSTSCFCNAGYENVRNCSTAECFDVNVTVLITLDRLTPCTACDPGTQH